MNFQQRYKYNHDDLLGKGGFSSVYKAFDVELQKEVALKIFNPVTGKDILSNLRFATNLKHPNITQVYDVCEVSYESSVLGNQSFNAAILEYINAGDFNSFLKTKPDRIILNQVLIGILRGLGYIHQNKIIHRDLKPQNILMQRTGDEWVPKIADFGISKLESKEASSIILGTIEYMAPEQFNVKKYGIAGQLSTNVDLWAFGVMVYEIISGVKLFGDRAKGISTEQVMLNILQKEIQEELKIIPSPWRETIEYCLIREAADRVQTADQLIKLLDNKIIEIQCPNCGKINLTGLDRCSACNYPLFRKSIEPDTFVNTTIVSNGAKNDDTHVVVLSELRNEISALNKTIGSVTEVIQITRADKDVRFIDSKPWEEERNAQIDLLFKNARDRAKSSWKLGVGMTLASFLIIIFMILAAVILTIYTGKDYWAYIFGGLSASTIIGTFLWAPYDRLFRATVLTQQVEVIHIQFLFTFRGSTKDMTQACDNAIAALSALFEKTR